jgi:AGZA family xanthine/uracil permease-like MFS transporter
MVLAATMAYVIDRQFHKAAGWMATAAVLAMIGVIHAYDLTSDGLQNKFGLTAAPDFAIAYGLTAILLLGLHVRRRPD